MHRKGSMTPYHDFQEYLDWLKRRDDEHTYKLRQLEADHEAFQKKMRFIGFCGLAVCTVFIVGMLIYILATKDATVLYEV